MNDMTKKRVDSYSIVITSSLLLLTGLYLSETAPQKDLGLYELSKKKEAIIKLWLTEKRDISNHNAASVMVSVNGL